jgi:hypothetical protein
MRAFELWLLPVFVVPVFAQQSTRVNGAEPIATTLCHVVAHPEKFADKRVRFGKQVSLIRPLR